MELPQVNGVGVFEASESFVRAPRNYPLGLRLFAAALTFAFITAILWTGANSLAQVCLTTYAAAPYPFGF